MTAPVHVASSPAEVQEIKTTEDQAQIYIPISVPLET